MIKKTRSYITRLRDEGWLRGTVVGPIILVLAFVAVFCYGFYLTGKYDVEVAQVDQDVDVVHASSGLFQRVWATLAMFTGGYISLSKEYDPSPPHDLSVVASFALLLTLVTAGSLVLLSRRARDFVRILRPRVDLVVIGAGSTAAAIIKSTIDHKLSTILVTDSRESEAARATKPSIPIVASGEIQSALSRVSARRVIEHARHVVIATDSDALNMELHSQVEKIRKAQSQDSPPGAAAQHRPKDLVVIHDADYADLLRPRVIRDELPKNEVTCPAENIAEHVCHLIVAAITGREGIRNAACEFVDVGSEKPPPQPAPNPVPTIEKWVSRLSWSLSFLDGKEGVNGKGPEQYESVPEIRMPGDPPLPEELLIRIFAGNPASSVVREALSQREPRVLRIVIANAHLVEGAENLRHRHEADRQQVLTGRQWLELGAPMDESRPPILVVDPADVGVDATLITDDTGTQWARTFDLTYNLMFSDGGCSVTGWQPGAPMGESTKRLERGARKRANSELKIRKRGENDSAPSLKEKPQPDPAREGWKARKEIANRYSSRRAVEHMLELLGNCGFQLQRHDSSDAPPKPPLTDEHIEYIAESEHEDWLVRRWPDTIRRLRRPRMDSVSRYSGSGANKYCYQGLKTLIDSDKDISVELRYAANYNRRIATETYPAIAASFGYAIVKSGSLKFPYVDRAECKKPGCPCPKDRKDRSR